MTCNIIDDYIACGPGKLGEEDKAEIERYKAFNTWRAKRVRENKPVKVIEFRLDNKKYRAKYHMVSETWNIFHEGIYVDNKTVYDYFDKNLKPDWSRSLGEFMEISKQVREDIKNKLESK